MKRMIYLSCLLVIIFFAIPAQAQIHEDVHVDLVEVYVSAVDSKDQAVTNLTKYDFELKVDEKVREITNFSLLMDPKSDVPLSLAFLIDTSRSMEAVSDNIRKIDLARDFALQILKETKPADRVQLFSFDSGVRSLTSFTSNPVEINDMLKSVQVNEQRKPGTALNYSLELLASHMQKYPGRRILILFSDGENNLPGPDLNSLVDSFRKSDVTVLCVGTTEIGKYRTSDSLISLGNSSQAGATSSAGVPDGSIRYTNPPPLPSSEVSDHQKAHDFLKRFAEGTAGVAFFPRTNSKLQDYLESIHSTIRGQYVLAFSSKSNEGNDWRKIEVSCKRKGVKIRYRKGYFAG